MAKLHLSLPCKTARAIHDAASHDNDFFKTFGLVDQIQSVFPVLGVLWATSDGLTQILYLGATLYQGVSQRLVVKRQRYAAHVSLKLTSGLKCRADALGDWAVWIVLQVLVCSDAV